MAIYVRVHRPARRREEADGQGQPAGPHHGQTGEIAGVFTDSGVRVLVALEDGKLVSFAPSDLQRVGVNKGFLQKLG